MLEKKNILLLCGGGSTEHDISLVSVKYLKECLDSIADFHTTLVVIEKNGDWVDENNNKRLLDAKRQLRFSDDSSKSSTPVDIAIPCIHGYPGETGDLQSYFEMINLPYLGCNSETSKMCFNKITTKLWATALGVKNTPYVFVSDLSSESQEKVLAFFKHHGEIVIKASNQGSSVGCYMAIKEEEVMPTLKKAFEYSPFVLVEKKLVPRELEVSLYEFDGKIQLSYPGEINCPSKFYSFEEKYSGKSQTTTEIKAPGLTDSQVATIHDYCLRLQSGLKLRHLSRIDFFLENGEIYLNEINTFPGMTPISMFPKMMEANGHSFKSFIIQNISKL